MHRFKKKGRLTNPLPERLGKECARVHGSFPWLEGGYMNDTPENETKPITRARGGSAEQKKQAMNTEIPETKKRNPRTDRVRRDQQRLEQILAP